MNKNVSTTTRYAHFRRPVPPIRGIISLVDQERLRTLLEDVKGGAVDVDAALQHLRHMPFEDLGFAKIDHHRAIRHGIPEVIFGKGKTPDQIIAIASRLSEKASNVLITRVDPAAAPQILAALPPGAEHFQLSGAIRIWRDHTVHGKGKLSVVCAGTTDIPVAEEAQITAELMGNEVDAIYDIGVAGIHRLMQNRERLTSFPRSGGLRRHGRRASERGGRSGVLPGDCGADQRRLRGEFPWAGGALARDAQQLCLERHSGEHRQRFWRRLRSKSHQSGVNS